MTTTFRLRQDEINETFLAKLRGLFAREDELEIVVHSSESGKTNAVKLETHNGSASSHFDHFDESYLNSKIALARESWAGVSDPEAWLRDARGYTDD